MNLNLRNRIAFFYLCSTAALTALLFILIFAVTKQTIYNYIEEKLEAEMEEVTRGLYIGNDTVLLKNSFEWEEREHGQVEVNPIYLTILDRKGNLIKKTDNLFEKDLEFLHNNQTRIFFNSTLAGKPARELQMPLRSKDGKISGYLLISIPMEESLLILDNLKKILILGFLAALILLFFITRWIAGKSILPIHSIINTSERISRKNLSERISLPRHKDEIFKLTSTVNGLLDRLEDAVLREKQFTADASHELRTPLSVIKGTLEVLVRKPREIQHYENKISGCIKEVDRMTVIIDQLLLLARYESEKIEPHARKIELNENVKYSMLRVEPLARDKKINLKFVSEKDYFVFADPIMLNIIIENILSNAVKYSNGNKLVKISIEEKEKFIVCSIKDYGIGMTDDEISRIFDRFYRAGSARVSNNSGNGLGLAIVKRLADLQNITIKYTSETGKGTTADIYFPALPI